MEPEMKRTSALWGLYGILVFGCLAAGAALCLRPRQEGAAATASVAIDQGRLRSASRSVYQGWGRNPFSLEKNMPDLNSGLNLRGIVWDKLNPQAIINDAIVKKGDRIGRHTVMDIGKNSVWVNDGANDFELTL
jgi:hypothetical protein